MNHSDPLAALKEYEGEEASGQPPQQPARGARKRQPTPPAKRAEQAPSQPPQAPSQASTAKPSEAEPPPEPSFVPVGWKVRKDFKAALRGNFTMFRQGQVIDPAGYGGASSLGEFLKTHEKLLEPLRELPSPYFDPYQ